MANKIPPENDDRNPHPLDSDVRAKTTVNTGSIAGNSSSNHPGVSAAEDELPAEPSGQEQRHSEVLPKKDASSVKSASSVRSTKSVVTQKTRCWHHPSWAIAALLFAVAGVLIGLVPFVGFFGYLFSLTAVGIGVYHLVNRKTFKYKPVFPALALGLGLLALGVPVMSSSWMVNNGPLMLMQWIQEQGWDMAGMPMANFPAGQQRIPGLEVQSVRYETREWNDQQSELQWQAVISHRDSAGVDLQARAIFMDAAGNVVWRSGVNKRLIPIVNDTLSKTERLPAKVAAEIESMSLNVERGF